MEKDNKTDCKGCEMLVDSWDKIPDTCDMKQDLTTKVNGLKEAVELLKKSGSATALKSYLEEKVKAFQADIKTATDAVIRPTAANWHWQTINKIYWGGILGLEYVNKELELLKAPEAVKPTRATAQNKEKKVKRYYQKMTITDPIKIKKLYSLLIEYGLIDKTTPCSHFCFVFGRMTIPDKEKPLKPIVWAGQQNELLVLLNNICNLEYEPAKWETTRQCFILKQADGTLKEVNKTTLRTDKHKDKEASFNNLIYKVLEKI